MKLAQLVWRLRLAALIGGCVGVTGGVLLTHGSNGFDGAIAVVARAPLGALAGVLLAPLGNRFIELERSGPQHPCRP